MASQCAVLADINAVSGVLQVIFVITHSGFTRSILLAVDREPYRPLNAEVVPVVVERKVKKVKCEDDFEDAESDDDEEEGEHEAGKRSTA